MTDTVGRLADLLRHRRVLLIDFDGPICAVFAGYPAPVIADELRKLASAYGIEIPPALAKTDDPLAFLREIAQVAPARQTRAVADALRDKELTAIESARETPGAFEVLRAAKVTGRRVAIVSNNSAEAVNAYLRRHGLHVDHVSAREGGMDPRHLKPDPYLVTRAVETLDANPGSVVFVGDSATDVDAGRAADITVIGFADKPAKRDRLTETGAWLTINEMSSLADAMTQAFYASE
jgi:HAD superfamily hydrolase (TIGR01549 family)